MKLYQWQDWKQECLNYWQNQIDNSSFSNKEELKNTLNSYISDLDSLLQDYMNEKNTKQQILMQGSLSLISYFQFKSMEKIPYENLGKPVLDDEGNVIGYVYPDKTEYDNTNLPSIPNLTVNNFKELFEYWKYELPDYVALFQLKQDNTVPSNGILETTDIYNTLKQHLQSLTDIDIQNLHQLQKEISLAITPVTFYILLHSEVNKYYKSNLNDLSQVLQDFGIQDVIDTFNLNLPGWSY